MIRFEFHARGPQTGFLPHLLDSCEVRLGTRPVPNFGDHVLLPNELVDRLQVKLDVDDLASIDIIAFRVTYNYNEGIPYDVLVSCGESLDSYNKRTGSRPGQL